MSKHDTVIKTNAFPNKVLAKRAVHEAANALGHFLCEFKLTFVEAEGGFHCVATYATACSEPKLSPIPRKIVEKPKPSSCVSPVKVVRELCEKNWGKPRKEIISMCIERGVNKSTASTQYGKFNKEKRISKEPPL